MDFSQALIELKLGNGIYRSTWDEGRFVKAHFPKSPNNMRQPYLFERCVDGTLVPWVPTQEDLLVATDWEVKPKKPKGR